MRRIVFSSTLVLISLLITQSSRVSAQEWSNAQLEVWSVIQAQWEAAKVKDATWPDRMLHDGFLGWGSDVPAPRTKASTKTWTRYEDENATTLMYELYPLGIVVEGNTAVAHYLYSVAAEDREGERETEHGRYTDILVRDGRTWRFIAWHGGASDDDED